MSLESAGEQGASGESLTSVGLLRYLRQKTALNNSVLRGQGNAGSLRAILEDIPICFFYRIILQEAAPPAPGEEAESHKTSASTSPLAPHLLTKVSHWKNREMGPVCPPQIRAGPRRSHHPRQSLAYKIIAATTTFLSCPLAPPPPTLCT